MRKVFLFVFLFACSLNGIYAQRVNIDKLIKSITLEEKARMLVGNGMGSFDVGFAITGSDATLVPGAAGLTVGVPRLGIPNTVLSDGPAGLRINPTREGTDKTYYCTGFPVGVSLASTWNAELVEEVGTAIGEEVLEYGADCLLAPAVNLYRNPLNGRNFEYMSEDPLLAGKIGAAYIRGVQSKGVGTSLKHFAVNNQETMRDYNDARLNVRPLRELYLRNFEIAVKEAQPWTMMTTVSAINGQPAKESYDLLTSILRKEWGYKGLVMTDWQPKTNTAAEIHAGNDLMEPGFSTQYQEIVESVKNGTLSEADLNQSVRRLLEYVMKTPRYKGYKYSDNPDLKAHAAITRQSATEGMVLLKNQGNVLPLKEVKNIALYGITSYDFIAGGTGSGDVNKAYTIDLVTGLTNAGYSINETVSNIYRKYKDYLRSKESASQSRGWYSVLGMSKLPEMDVPYQMIENQVESTDLAIVTIGRISGENLDREVEGDFNLTEVEYNLIKNVSDCYHKVGKKVVVILNIGAVVETASWKDLPDAILCAWMPGQEGGNSVADVLNGKSYPSGKLTTTFPISYYDIPSAANFPTHFVRPEGMTVWAPRTWEMTRNQDYTIYEEGIWVGYRYFNTYNKKVSYPFGYGLSYTEFSYSNPRVKSTKNGFVASVTVTNTGKYAGKEIVELYVSAPNGGLVKPESELRSFAKTRELQPGESQTLTFEVDSYYLASFREDISAWESPKGTYVLKFASNVDDVRCTADYKLNKTKVWKVNNVLNPQQKIEEMVYKP
ncbi:MAG: glycoside hydrolase family 3 C-terminal domain-containing protein [Bacteroidaceae bacterium]|nr:glycoside hydrolase family 3 C-terminal domain-containing protein [Bacteroidaceae bacterium]